MPNDTSKTQKKATSTTFHLLAGLGSGFTSSILLQPADLLKTRLQQSSTTTLLATLRQIRSQPHPIRQLWRGTLPSVIRTSMGSALYFTTLNAFRTSLAKREVGVATTTTAMDKQKDKKATTTTSSSLPQLTPLANLLSGAIARASVGFIMMPITVLKVRYESNYYSYTSLSSAALDIARREGAKGFFAGFGATAIRDAPYAGLYVVFYEAGKRRMSALATGHSRGETRAELAAAGPTPMSVTTTTTTPAPTISPTLSSTINFTSATLAASLATALTNPPDAIKTRLQLQPQKYKNTLQALKLMLAEEGVRSLFDGLALRMARKAMSSALAWTVYEEVVRRAEVRFAGGGGVV